jgi:hypothetical protein
LDRVYPTYQYKPIMISETSAADCNNYAPDRTMIRSQWIRRLFEAMAARPAVRAFFWFNENKPAEANWTINACPNPGGRRAYQVGVAHPRFLTR